MTFAEVVVWLLTPPKKPHLNRTTPDSPPVDEHGVPGLCDTPGFDDVTGPAPPVVATTNIHDSFEVVVPEAWLAKLNKATAAGAARAALSLGERRVVEYGPQSVVVHWGPHKIQGFAASDHVEIHVA